MVVVGVKAADGSTYTLKVPSSDKQLRASQQRDHWIEADRKAVAALLQALLIELRVTEDQVRAELDFLRFIDQKQR